MKVLGVIPARYGATRFPGKPLFVIAGKPLLQWVIEGTKQSRLLSEIVVATDDARIADLAKACGVEAVMTDSALPSGTDRAWAVAKTRAVDAVVNIQGDEPMITGGLIDQLAGVLAEPNPPEMATLAHPISLDDLASPNAVKVIVNRGGDAIYFSRFAIPHSRVEAKNSPEGPVSLKHIGLYAYSKNFLEKFCSSPQALIEKSESLEQLRALDLGARIRVIRVDRGLQGVDTPDDAAKVEGLLGTR